MIEEKQKEIINKLNSSSEIKRFKKLEEIIKNNDEYNKLIEEFEEKKELYEKEDRLNEEIINLRKKLFSINEIKEYSKLEKDIRLLSKKISNIISSVVDKGNCSKD